MRPLIASSCLVATWAWMVLVSAPVWAELPTETACFAPATFTEDVDPKEYLTDLQIETRKAGLATQWRSVEQALSCPSGRPLLFFVLPGRVKLTHPKLETPVDYDLTNIELSNRASSLARAVMGQLARLENAAAGESVPLLDLNGEISLWFDPAEQSSGTKSLVWWARTTGLYLHQFKANRHFAGVSAELGISLFEERLAFSLSGMYAASPEVNRDGIITGLDMGEILTMIRGGLPLGPVFVRAGVGGGWQRRNVTANSENQEAPDALAASEVGVLAADLEAFWRFADRWRLVLLVNARAYLGGADHLWLGETIYGAPTVAVGTQLGVGMTL